jgi:hypothetical protein
VRNERRAQQSEISEMQKQIEKLINQLDESRNEVNIYKGKCNTQSRDIELAQTTLSKKVQEQSSQLQHSLDVRRRITDLETQILQANSEKNELQFEMDRVKKSRVLLEEEIQKMKEEAMKQRGNLDSGNAAASRMEIMLNAAKQETNLLKNDNESLETILQKNKNELLEADKKALYYFNELQVQTQNNKLLQNEQKILSDELTANMDNLRKIESERLALERELLELRPLRNQVQNLNTATQRNLEQTMSILR